MQLTPAQIRYLSERHDRLRQIAHAAPDHSRSGVFIVTIDGGQDLRVDVVTCGHCDFTWQHLPHSGRRRGFCTLCGKYVCGRDYCNLLGCTSPEQRLENMERGRAFDFRPVTVSTSGLLLPG